MAAKAGGAELRGVVTTTEGQPVEHAYVKGIHGFNWTKTDHAGRYTIPTDPSSDLRVISFRALNYRPLTRIVTSDTTILNAVLEDSEKTEWKIPFCGPGTAWSTISEWKSPYRMQITGASGPARKYHDIDYAVMNIPVILQDRTYRLRTMDGIYNSDGRPNLTRYLDADKFQERAWTLPYARRVPPDERIFSQGVDVRGRDKAGWSWRWIGDMGGGMVMYYEGVPTAAALVFDRIVDSLCVVPIEFHHSAR